MERDDTDDRGAATIVIIFFFTLTVLIVLGIASFAAYMAFAGAMDTGG